MWSRRVCYVFLKNNLFKILGGRILDFILKFEQSMKSEIKVEKDAGAQVGDW